MMDDLERELDEDVSSARSIFRGTGSPGKPSNVNLFYESPKKGVAEMLKDQDQAELLVTEAQVLRARAERKELEAMEKELK